MIIGFTGAKGSGKDTAASFLIEERGYARLGFADALKNAVAALFDLTVEQVDLLKNDLCWVELRHPLSSEAITFSWRKFLQRFGTEMGRNVFGQDFWVELWEDAAHDLKRAHEGIVTPDVRFINEADTIRAWGGFVIEIRRPGHEPDGHASEEGLPPNYIDAAITNDGDLDQFKTRVLGTIDALD